MTMSVEPPHALPGSIEIRKYIKTYILFCMSALKVGWHSDLVTLTYMSSSCKHRLRIDLKLYSIVYIIYIPGN